MAKRGGPVLVDLYCYKPPDELSVSMVDVDTAWNDKRKQDKEASVSLSLLSALCMHGGHSGAYAACPLGMQHRDACK